ncbi:MAG TPA: fasciclin domain-containing protein [Nitrososphaerales archaeon]|nr:fasciclin domain-containing protein [Nitrososphaerales archaeon]
MNNKNIVETAVSAGSFKTLVAAVKAAGLVDALSGEGPFTVFAPDDEAFAKLPAGTVEGLLQDIPKLRSILTYHVVPGRVTASEVKRITSEGQTPKVTTLQGSAITLKIDGMFSKTVHVNDAKVISADIGASNGVIHVIDKVIMPPLGELEVQKAPS